MIRLSIKADFSEVQKNLNKLSFDIQKIVIPSALNKVIAKANTEMTRAISSEYNISQSELRSRLKITKAARSVDKWFAILDPYASSRRGRSLNLIRFLEKKVTLAEAKRRKKTQTLDQLRFQIKRAGGKKIITGAFIGNKGRTVFVREGSSRLPIKALSTIDVPQMFNTRKIQSRVKARILSELYVEFDRAIKAALDGNIR